MKSRRVLGLLTLLVAGCIDTGSAERREPGSEEAAAPATSAPSEPETPAAAPAGANAAVPSDSGVPNEQHAMNEPSESELELATFGAGCFWCTEAVLEQLDGVTDAVSGYMGGHVERPTYEQVCSKQSGHIEVTQVTFDPAKISYETLLDWFWQLHDPTSLDRQGADAGPQYRSAIFTHSPAQAEIAEESRAAVDASGRFAKPIVTEIRPAETFWPAEKEHQDFYRLNKGNSYCRAVIAPKLRKLELGH